MGVATALIAAVLAVDVDLRTTVAEVPVAARPELIVDIQRLTPVRDPQPDVDSPRVELEPVAIPLSKRVGTLLATAISVDKTAPTRDWHELAAMAGKEQVEEYFRQEDIRAAMWEKSRSSMFANDDPYTGVAEAPILANLRFREPVGVVGIGFTIGSCFFGVPLAGIPVEDRTVAITVLYCGG